MFVFIKQNNSHTRNDLQGSLSACSQAYFNHIHIQSPLLLFGDFILNNMGSVCWQQNVRRSEQVVQYKCFICTHVSITLSKKM